MKIIERSLTEEARNKNDYKDSYAIIVDGVEEVAANDYGEPEDNTLGRDLNFVYSIVPLMRRAWESGKNGEAFEVSEEQVEE